MRKFIQIIPITVLGGTLTKEVDFTFQANGQPTHCAVYGIDKTNDVLTRASIKDGAGVEIVPMHNINNFRDREADYLAGKMPLDMKGSNRGTFSILLKATDIADRKYELVLIMETEN